MHHEGEKGENFWELCANNVNFLLTREKSFKLLKLCRGVKVFLMRGKSLLNFNTQGRETSTINV